MANEHKADGRPVEYQRPIYGGSLRGAFKLPHSAIAALGDGNPEAGYAATDEMFGHPNKPLSRTVADKARISAWHGLSANDPKRTLGLLIPRMPLVATR